MAEELMLKDYVSQERERKGKGGGREEWGEGLYVDCGKEGGKGSDCGGGL